MYGKVAGGSTAAGVTGGTLAHTGSQAMVYAIAAATCLLAGAAMMRWARHRRLN